ncbi:unnamed protein product [Symbiodinium microadriaticum]|nr:unnamed protein product [Symbiodinium microadriaticum]
MGLGPLASDLPDRPCNSQAIFLSSSTAAACSSSLHTATMPKEDRLRGWGAPCAEDIWVPAANKLPTIPSQPMQTQSRQVNGQVVAICLHGLIESVACGSQT